MHCELFVARGLNVSTYILLETLARKSEGQEEEKLTSRLRVKKTA
jgi:hypothetical protein